MGSILVTTRVLEAVPHIEYEGLFSVTTISAAGIACLAGWPVSRLTHYVRYFDWRKLRPLQLTFVLGYWWV